MKAFGLELRRADVSSLYLDVDRIVQSANANEVQKMGVAHALSRMLEPDRWFCTCTISDCAKLCGIIIPFERKKLYDVMHCIHWSKMDIHARETLVAFVLDDFRTILTQ